MELIRAETVTQLSNSGVVSRQLLFPENSRSARITITRVTIQPGARNAAHRHESTEQVWVALRGNGRLLLGDDKTVLFAEGDVVVSRTASCTDSRIQAERSSSTYRLPRRRRTSARRMSATGRHPEQR